MSPLSHLSHRPTYTLPALQKYLEHIRLPLPQQKTLLQNLPKPNSPVQRTEWGTSLEALHSLTTLQRHQQARIPFANLYLHYSPCHFGTPLDAEGVFRYLVQSEGMVGTSSGYARSLDAAVSFGIVESPMASGSGTIAERTRQWEGRRPSGGRGGTCTLNNGFFGTVMRSLGMRVMTTGARVSKGYNGATGVEGMYMGWNHLVNLVSFEGKWWLVDVGFGGDGPTRPIEVVDGNEVPWGSTGSMLRLVHKPIPEFTDPSSKVWVLQHKPFPTAPTSIPPSARDPEPGALPKGWRDIYCFSTTEFLPQDITVMHSGTAGNIRSSFFNHIAICTRTVLDGDEVIGTLGMLGGKVKRKVFDKGGSDGGWRHEVVAECKSEVERWEALEKWFGIVLGDEERRGIKGLVSELKGES